MAFGQRALTGPRLPPQRGQATHLVVLCHGYGADGNDLIGLAPHWQRQLPTVAFVAPNAPERCPGSPTGFQWFAISRLDPGEMQKGVESRRRGSTTFSMPNSRGSNFLLIAWH
jgi:phospholipase/carboxylesterase